MSQIVEQCFFIFRFSFNHLQHLFLNFTWCIKKRRIWFCQHFIKSNILCYIVWIDKITRCKYSFLWLVNVFYIGILEHSWAELKSARSLKFLRDSLLDECRLFFITWPTFRSIQFDSSIVKSVNKWQSLISPHYH